MALDWTIISGAAAAVVSAIAAAVAAIVSLLTMREAKDMAAQQRASDCIRRYLELAIEHPKLSTDENLNKQEQEQQQYEWFVSFTLMTAREALRAYPKDLNWRTMISDQLKYNAPELKAWKKQNPRVFKAYGDDVEKLVEEALAEDKSK